MSDDGGWKNVGSRALILCALAFAACGPEGTSTGDGSGSGGPAVHTLNIDVAGNGSVSSSPAGIDCGTKCSATFAEGTAVTLSTMSASGSNLTAWTGACSGTSSCVIVLNVDATVGATFVAGAPPPPPPPPPPSTDECADLVPASLPPPAVAEVSSDNLPCSRGVSDDGDGTFLLGYFTGRGPVFPAWDFFQVQDGKAIALNKRSFGSDQGDKFVFSQPSGFSTFTISGQTEGSDLGTWSHDGDFVSSVPIAPNDQSLFHPPSSAVGIDPSGGTATAKTVFTNDSGWVTSYQRFDKHGVAETGEVQIDTGEHRAGGVGVAPSGHALLLTSLGNPTWQARWVARDGSPVSGPFNLQGPEFPAFQFLADGSLAVGFVNGFSDAPTNFVYRIEDGGSVAGPLPDWLAPRAANQLYVVRSGKAYATWGAGGQCGGDLEILAVSGKSCGCVKVPNLTASASVGRDGSLIVPGQKISNCAYDLYPKLLR